MFGREEFEAVDEAVRGELGGPECLQLAGDVLTSGQLPDLGVTIEQDIKQTTGVQH